MTWLPLFVLLAGSAAGYVPFGRTTGCVEVAKPFCDALKLPNPEQRRTAAWNALREALLSDRKEVREGVWGELERLSWSTDLSPYLRLIDELTPPTKRNEARDLEDRIVRLFGPRTARAQLFLRAIRFGTAVEEHGSVLQRKFAVSLAASQGLSEVRSAVEEYLTTLPPERQTIPNLDGTLPTFDLCEGAMDGVDCPRVATARLESMDPAELHKRIASDSQFRSAVASIRQSACDNLYREPSQYCQTFQKWSGALQETHPTMTDSAARQARPQNELRWIDPCTVPEFSQYLTQGTHWGAYSRLSVTGAEGSGGKPDPVGIAEGLEGHRDGDVVRFRVQVHERTGGEPAWPVGIRVEAPEGMPGSVSPPGQGLHCQRIQFLWNHPEAGGGVVPVFQDFDYTVAGKPEFVGVVPTAADGKSYSEIWKASTKLKITIGEYLKYGEEVHHDADAEWDIRPQGKPPRDPERSTIQRLETILRSAKDKAVFLDSNFERPETLMVQQPRVAYVATQADGAGPSFEMTLSSSRENGEAVSSGIHLVLYRVGQSSIYLGKFRLVPENYPTNALGSDIEAPLGGGHSTAQSNDPPKR